MTEQTIAANPYIIDGPILDAHLFFGRSEVFAWAQANLDAFPLRQLLVLSGPAQIGKSSVLRQFELRRLGRNVLPVYVDLAQASIDSLSLFYRSLAETAVAALQRAGIEFSELSQVAFVNNPGAAFNQYVLQTATTALNGRKILFLLDNVNRFIDQVDDGYLELSVLAELDQLLRRLPQVYALYALETSAVAAVSEQLAFFNEAQYYELTPFNSEVAASLICEPVHYTIVKDVANYIYGLTQGYPHQIQILCHALYERQAQYGLRQITVVDVVAVHRALALSGVDGLTAMPLPEYAAGSSQLTVKSMTNGASPARARFPVWIVASLSLVIIVVLAVLFWQRQRANSITAQVSPAPTATILATETAVLTPTAPTASAAVAAVAQPSPTHTTAPTTTPTATPSPSPSATPSPSPTASTTATPTPTPGAYPLLVVRDIDDMEMVYIPAGSFSMGSLAEDFTAGADEKPQHLVVLNHFYMDKYEVSVAQYAAFLNQLGGYERACARVDCALPRERVGYTSYLLEQDLGDGTILYAAMTGFANYPMNHVSWYGAAAYCEYVGGRLPTEAEWEYAARGDDGRTYPWGNQTPDQTRAVFQSQSFDDLKPVFALPDGASPFGVYGMAGSVWEWTADWYDENYYAESPTANPTGPSSGLARAVRGGAWPNNNEADRIRSANRLALDPLQISSTVGFRCVRNP